MPQMQKVQKKHLYCLRKLIVSEESMDIKKEKEKIRLNLAELRVEAIHLISNIDDALSQLDTVKTEEEAKLFTEKYDVEQGLKRIEIF